MRSELVFAANDAVTNRFLLCRVVSLSSRRFHADSDSMNATINDVLEKIGANDVNSVIAPLAPPAKHEFVGPAALLIAMDERGQE